MTLFVVDQAAIARRFSVSREAVKWWRQNGRSGTPFPSPLEGDTARPVWDAKVVDEWFEATRPG